MTQPADLQPLAAGPPQRGVTLPFGRHRGEPLAGVPTPYLEWALAECKLSSGLYAATAAELRARGLEVAERPAPALPACRRCGPAGGYRCSWEHDSLGRPRIRAACGRCGAFLAFAPQVPPYTAQADARA
jgi:hypothetical protein